jgi:uncharacterized membrane-anchored protein YjiN (DUF445 family)
MRNLSTGKGRNRIGIISLGIAGAGFLIVTFQPWVPLDRLILFNGLSLKRFLAAFFDASLVGALADWFAVTALFQNPLGVKLPHTDILAKNKDTIAEAVPRFLMSFVSEDKISVELDRVDFASRVGELLGRAEARQEINDFIRGRISPLLEGFTSSGGPRTEGFRIFLDGLFGFLAEKIDAATALASLIRWARREAFADKLINTVAGVLRLEIDKNRMRLASYITPMIKRNAGWRGFFVGQGTVERLLSGVKEELERIQADPGHEIRRLLFDALDSYASRLTGEIPDPQGDRERLGATVRRALADGGFQAGCAEFLADLVKRLGLDLARPESRFIQGLERVEDALQSRLSGSPETRRRFNLGIAGLISGFITKSRLVESLSGYLAALLKATDEREFVARIENAVWNDLQYIRVNGAVVGGLVGVVLAVVSVLFPG